MKKTPQNEYIVDLEWYIYFYFIFFAFEDEFQPLMVL